MDLGLSEQQEMVRAAGREFLEAECPTKVVRELEASEKGYSPELWSNMAGRGWLGLLIPTQYGGAGGDLVDQEALSEEIGRALLPSPLLTSAVLCGQTILKGGSEEQKARLLPQIAQGETIVTLALAEAGGWHIADNLEVTAVADGGDYVINGTKLFVHYAHIADQLLVVAKTSGGATLFLVDRGSPGVAITLLESTAEFKQHEVRFENVRVSKGNIVGEVDRGWGPLAEAIDLATVLQAAEMVGRSERALEMTVEYSKFRIAFGRPIAMFQGLQHQAADLRVAVDGARMVTRQAAWKISEGLPAAEDVHIAKAAAGAASRRSIDVSHGIFAGIAYTVEHDVQLFSMRGKFTEANLGDAHFHVSGLADLMGDES